MKPKPKTLENILIEDFASEGKSIAKYNGKAIFVESGVPGDLVNISLTKSKKDWAEGYITHFLKKSEQRIEPLCKHAGTCGGCQWQVVDYKTQIKFKYQQVVDNFTRIGKFTLPPILPIIPATETFYYRNKLEYTFAEERYIPQNEYLANDKDKNSQPFAAGFHAKGFFNKVVHIDQCLLQKSPSNEIRKTIVDFALEHNCSFYNIKQKKGWLRNLIVRNNQDNRLLINIVFGEHDLKNIELLCAVLLKKFPEIESLVYTINSKVNDSIFDLEQVIYFGNGFLYEKLGSLTFKISPKSFFQTNTLQTINLYTVIKNMVFQDTPKILYDLYCGTGSIGLFCSDIIEKLVGVELSSTAIEDAQINAQINKVDNCIFVAGDVINICTESFFQEHGIPDIIIIDPPRAGIHPKMIDKLLNLKVPTIIYVSCNPATQARDLNLLSTVYTIDQIQPIDMFPQTKHIECVVKLIKT